MGGRGRGRGKEGGARGGGGARSKESRKNTWPPSLTHLVESEGHVGAPGGRADVEEGERREEGGEEEDGPAGHQEGGRPVDAAAVGQGQGAHGQEAEADRQVDQEEEREGHRAVGRAEDHALERGADGAQSGTQHGGGVGVENAKNEEEEKLTSPEFPKNVVTFVFFSKMLGLLGRFFVCLIHGSLPTWKGKLFFI